MPTSSLQLSDATFGVITALPKEYAAIKIVLACVDETASGNPHSEVVYALARLSAQTGGHHVVAIALLPDMGNNFSAIVTTTLLNDCPNVRHVIMCGIAGAVPYPEKVEQHVRLGDLVVCDRHGVVQYDLDKETSPVPNQVNIEHRPPPRPPSAALVASARRLMAGEYEGKRPWEAYAEEIIRNEKRWKRPPSARDRLHDWHDDMPPTQHPRDASRRDAKPRVFHGPIASANKLLKNPAKRDALRDGYGVKAVEMEASGIADAVWTSDRASYFVVRGTCDYCNKDKGDCWQEHAALLAACYTRALIEETPRVATEHSLASGSETPSIDSAPAGLRDTNYLGLVPTAVASATQMESRSVIIFQNSTLNISGLPTADLPETLRGLTDALENAKNTTSQPNGIQEKPHLVSTSAEDHKRIINRAEGTIRELRILFDGLEFEQSFSIATEFLPWLREHETLLPPEIASGCYTILAEVEISRFKQSPKGLDSISAHMIRELLQRAKDVLVRNSHE